MTASHEIGPSRRVTAPFPSRARGALGRALLALALALPPAGAIALAPAPAWADDDAAKAAARELANKGYEHYAAGEYQKAIPFFKDAEARYHAPTLLLIQAKAWRKLNGLVEARDLYRRIADEKLADDAPQEFLDAQVEAKKELDLVSARIATLEIVLKGMTPDRVRVTIDDVEIPPDKVLTPLPQNPGPHRIVATIGGDGGGRAVFQSVTLKEGTTKKIQLVFRPGTPAATPPSAGGCASCAIGASGEAAPAQAAGLLSAAAAAVASALRRRRRARG